MSEHEVLAPGVLKQTPDIRPCLLVSTKRDGPPKEISLKSSAGSYDVFDTYLTSVMVIELKSPWTNVQTKGAGQMVLF